MKILLAVMLVSCFAYSHVIAGSPSEVPTDHRVDHSAWDKLLADNVSAEGKVDYANISARYRGTLDDYLKKLSRIDTSALSRQQQLAYYINLYNATMVQAVIDRYHDGFSPADDDFAVFKDKLVRLGDREISLNELENDILRKEFREPRIHVALVCAAESCPPLLPRAYRADDLDQVLDENMRRFVNDPARNPIDPDKKQARLSKIFDWYADDFGGKSDLLAFLSRYGKRDLAQYQITFVDYSWRLNAWTDRQTAPTP